MKLDPPVNNNYAATVVRVNHLIPLEGCDNVVGFPMFGLQAIVGKNTQVGDLGILFTAETQLSDEYCHENNLYRHSNLNKDKAVKGYIEDNRRVRAIKFRGHRSDALFMPLHSLGYMLGYMSVPNYGLKEGDTFDKINGHEICRKYVNPRAARANKLQPMGKKGARVEAKMFPEHIDSDNFFKVADTLNPEINVIVTQKLHGTSIRIGNTLVRREPTWLEKIGKWFGMAVQEWEYDNVYGSRKVIKDANNPNQNHFYDTDLWSLEGKKLDSLIPQGYIVYGELVGWTPEGAPIQPHYTYDVPKGKCELYVYRVAFVNPQGVQADLSWDGVRAFCGQTGLKHVRELYRTKLGSLTTSLFQEDSQTLLQLLMDVKFHEQQNQFGKFRDTPVPLSADSPCDEGVCIRAESIIPRIWKAKSPMFLQMETKLLDKDIISLEDIGSMPE